MKEFNISGNFWEQLHMLLYIDGTLIDFKWILWKEQIPSTIVKAIGIW